MNKHVHVSPFSLGGSFDFHSLSEAISASLSERMAQLQSATSHLGITSPGLVTAHKPLFDFGRAVHDYVGDVATVPGHIGSGVDGHGETQAEGPDGGQPREIPLLTRGPDTGDGAIAWSNTRADGGDNTDTGQHVWPGPSVQPPHDADIGTGPVWTGRADIAVDPQQKLMPDQALIKPTPILDDGMDPADQPLTHGDGPTAVLDHFDHMGDGFGDNSQQGMPPPDSDVDPSSYSHAEPMPVPDGEVSIHTGMVPPVQPVTLPYDVEGPGRTLPTPEDTFHFGDDLPLDHEGPNCIMQKLDMQDPLDESPMRPGPSLDTHNGDVEPMNPPAHGADDVHGQVNPGPGNDSFDFSVATAPAAESWYDDGLINAQEDHALPEVAAYADTSVFDMADMPVMAHVDNHLLVHHDYGLLG